MPDGRRRFGNAAIVALLLAQVLDGSLTYVGVSVFGQTIEANPCWAGSWSRWAMDPR